MDLKQVPDNRVVYSETFHSKYGFKTACRINKLIQYEGIYIDCPETLLEVVETTPEKRKFIMVYTRININNIQS